MAIFNFRTGEGIKATSPEILLKGVGIQALKARLFRTDGFIKSKSELEEDFKGDKKSYLGTPIFDPLTIKGGRFFELDDIKSSNEIDYDGLLIPAVIIEITQSKNIITTAMQGRNGTIKEFISDGDFAITITGIIIGQNEGTAGTKDARVKDIGNVYPEDDVKKLITILKVPDVLTLTSTFLNDIFGINQLVITNYSIPQREGSIDMQPFQISMLTDTAIDLEELTIQ